MKKHVKNYYKHFELGVDDIILCEHCEARAVDIHHLIPKSQLGSDEIENLIALCRSDHELAHASRAFNDYLKEIVKGRTFINNR